MRSMPLAAAAAALFIAGCAANGTRDASSGRTGVLVMAHGGGPEWDRLVREAAGPLRERWPVAVAFGMARADTLQEAVSELEGAGVRRVAVVRLFLSGDSFLGRTEKILGVEPGAGARPADWDAMLGHEGHHMHHGGPDAMPLWKIQTESEFALSREGLLDGTVGEAILARRALDLSRDPARESVLLLAHGVGDDRADSAWKRRMEGAAEAVRAAAPFRRVGVETMRDDWPEKREESREAIRAFIERANEDGGRAIVVPYRLSGFGPQADMLEGLEFVSDGKGLLPHPSITDWMRSQAQSLIRSRSWD